jgi:hypothetical protein
MPPKKKSNKTVMATHIAAVVKVCKGNTGRQHQAAEAGVEAGPPPLASITDHYPWEGSADAYDVPPPLEHIDAGTELAALDHNSAIGPVLPLSALAAAGVSMELNEDGDDVYVFTSGLNDGDAIRGSICTLQHVPWRRRLVLHMLLQVSLLMHYSSWLGTRRPRGLVNDPTLVTLQQPNTGGRQMIVI